jgi:hypothetical protein
MREFEQMTLFGLFVRKVIVPNLEVEESDLRAHMQEHIDEYTYPAMIRLESLSYASRDDARSALEKLRRGADLAWVREHVPGRLPPSEQDPVSRLRGNLVALSTLPPAIRAALAEVRSDEFRFAEKPDGPYYVLAVREMVPERTRPFEEIRSELREAVFARKRLEAVRSYLSEIREVSEVQVLAEGEALRRAILDQTGAVQ